MAQSTDLQRLVVSLEARLDKYTRAMEGAARDTDRITARIAGQFTRLERQFSTFGRTLIGGFIGLQGLRAIGEAIDKIADIGEIADRIGISTRALQAMHEMARKTGASLEQVDRGLQSIAEQSAQKGSFLDRLFQANKLQISNTDTEANLRRFMDLLRNAQSESQRLFLATSVFGDKVGRQVVEAFSQGSAAIDETFEKLQGKNRAITDDAIKEANEIRQEFRDVAADVEVTWAKMALGMVHALQKVGDALGAILGRAVLPDIATPTRRGQPLTPQDYQRLNALRQSQAAGSGPYPFSDIIAEAAKKYNLDPAILAGLIQKESSFNPGAKNPISSAAGLTQLLSGTAADLGVTNPYDPQQSIMGGAQYLRQMLDRFGNINTALAAYYQGPNAVTRGGVSAEGNAYATAVQFNAARFAGPVPMLQVAGVGAGTTPGAPAGSTGTTESPMTAEDIKKLTDELDAARDAVKGFFGDLIAGLRAGKSLTDTLATAFDNLASKAIDQVLNQLVGLLLGTGGTTEGGFLGGLLGFGTQARASGGPVSAGVPYLVGERGRELFVPDVAGRIVPNSGMGGGQFGVQVLPSKYFDVHVMRLSAAGDARTLDAARRSFPGTAATFQKLGTTSR